MAKVTTFGCIDERGERVLCDAFGNNVAFKCPDCGHPVLAIVRKDQRGSSKDKFAECPHCRFRGWVDADFDLHVPTIRRVDGLLD